MAKPTTSQVEIVNEHREALALAVYEHQMVSYNAGARNVDGTPPNHEAIRIHCNSIKYRCDVLEHPSVMQRYVQIRGFDPREVRAAPSIRWLQ